MMEEIGWKTKVLLVIIFIAVVSSSYSLLSKFKAEEIILIITLTSFFGWFFLKILRILNGINANLRILISVSDKLRSHLSEIDNISSKFDWELQKLIHWNIRDISNDLKGIEIYLNEIRKSLL
jgi:hypothetical protein